MTASNGVLLASMSIAPNELMASTIRPLPCLATTCATSCSGLSTPAPVSQCTRATWVMDGSAASALSTSAALTCWASL